MLPDRKKWDARGGSYMRYPGIPPVQIGVGQHYLIDYIDMEVPMRLWHTVIRASSFKNGRRWTIRYVAPKDGYIGTCSFLYEHEILEQHDQRLVVGMPLNYAPFNPHRSDHQLKQTA